MNVYVMYLWTQMTWSMIANATAAGNTLFQTDSNSQYFIIEYPSSAASVIDTNKVFGVALYSTLSATDATTINNAFQALLIQKK